MANDTDVEKQPVGLPRMGESTPKSVYSLHSILCSKLTPRQAQIDAAREPSRLPRIVDLILSLVLLLVVPPIAGFYLYLTDRTEEEIGPYVARILSCWGSAVAFVSYQKKFDDLPKSESQQEKERERSMQGLTLLAVCLSIISALKPMSLWGFELRQTGHGVFHT